MNWLAGFGHRHLGTAPHGFRVSHWHLLFIWPPFEMLNVWVLVREVSRSRWFIVMWKDPLMGKGYQTRMTSPCKFIWCVTEKCLYSGWIFKGRNKNSKGDFWSAYQSSHTPGVSLYLLAVFLFFGHHNKLVCWPFI